MSPSEVHVVYNKYSNEIMWVAAEQFLAERRWQFMVENETENDSVGMVSNKNKLVVCTLERALAEIAREHVAIVESIRNEQGRWPTY